MEPTRPWSASMWRSGSEAYCEPCTPFRLSSGYSNLIDLLLTFCDQREDLASNVALEGMDRVELGMAFSDALFDVCFRFWVNAEADESDYVERAVGSAIAALVKR